jgi:hypothetical protein
MVSLKQTMTTSMFLVLIAPGAHSHFRELSEKERASILLDYERLMKMVQGFRSKLESLAKKERKYTKFIQLV